MLETEIIKLFMSSRELKEHFSLQKGIILNSNGSFYIADLAIYKSGLLYAIVECKKSLKPNDYLKNTLEHLQKALNNTKCQYAILTNGSESLIIDKDKTDKRLASFEELVKFLTDNNHTSTFTNVRRDEIAQILTKYNFDEFIPKLQHNDSNYTFTEETENEFISKLLDSKYCIGIIVYRYMSFETAFNILKNRTFRMNSIVGMNDKSEVYYFDKYVYGKVNDSSKSNDTYISSFSLLQDDLTMWRLYGDNGKGVCMAFRLKKTPKHFMFNTVCYDTKPLTILNELVKCSLSFNNDSDWKHFFKSREYAIEKEFRLIYNKTLNRNDYRDNDWYITGDNHILTKYITFGLLYKDFPLELTKVIVGPKCPGQELNMIQLQQVWGKYDNNVTFESSKIESYR